MLYAMLAACATLIFDLALAVPHAAKAHRLARLFRAQQEVGRDDGSPRRGKTRMVRSDGPARRRCGVHV